jgi:hypothetical protein
MERIDTLLNLLREEISRAIFSEERTHPTKPPDDTTTKSIEPTRPTPSSTNNSEEKFANRSPAQVEAAQRAFKQRWRAKTKVSSIYDEIC